ncbi:SDH family Clp fold serine proteinase [Thermus tengchongensis]|uniref:SDH family Clp fold serine proteinase n=1 Tax=Thermus tengchongensis TaxID=1214928 RepID=UPI00056E8D12|nr:ATP-dependent Clp protease proteolytic subunit [Thermus tengchongensis]
MDVGTLVNSLFWLFLIFAFLSPYLQRQALEAARTRQILNLERRRKSRVITLIHRQEAISLLGVPLVRYIDVDDSEEVLRAIRLTDPQVPIDLILHTPGGLVLAAEQIALALLRHPAKVTVFVPHYAMSGGTLIALAADEIVMDENAVLGPIDPQIGDAPAASLLALLQTKPIDKIEDATLIKADIAAKAMKQVAEVAEKLLAKHMDPDKARTTARLLSQGTWTHDYPITVEEARGLGLPVSTDMPREVYALMELYPQTQMRRPSVQYIPTPYGRDRT